VNTGLESVASCLRDILTEYEAICQSQFEKKDTFGCELESTEPLDEVGFADRTRTGETGVIELIKTDAATMSQSTPLIEYHSACFQSCSSGGCGGEIS
jgi:hypothetical protein